MAAKVIGSVGTVDNITIGGMVFTDIANLKVLVGYGDNTGKYSVGVTPGGSSYVVPGGKSFRILGVLWNEDNGGAPVLGYNDVNIGLNSATTPTNFVNTYGTSSLLLQLGLSNGTTAAISPNSPFIPYNVKFEVPTGKYPTIAYTAAGNYKFQIYGYEV